MFTRTGPYASSTAWNPRTSRIGGVDQVDRAEWSSDELAFASQMAAARRAMRAAQMAPETVGEGGPIILEARRSGSGLSAQFPLAPASRHLTASGDAGTLSLADVFHVVDDSQIDPGDYNYH